MVLLRQEVDVSGGDDAHQFAAHLARLRDGDAGEAVSGFGLDHVLDGVAWAHHHRVRDKTLLKPLETEKDREVSVCFPPLSKIEAKQTKKSFKPNTNTRVTGGKINISAQKSNS